MTAVETIDLEIPTRRLVPPRGAHPIPRFILRRIAAGVGTLIVASLVVFFATSVLPGSPASAVLGRQATPEAVAEIDHRVGYDRPITTRYFDWLGGAVKGDFGDSALAEVQGLDSPVQEIIREPARNTIVLALIAVLFLIPISLVGGMIAGSYAGRWQDHAISTLTLVMISMPEFIIGALLVAVFSVGLDVLPPVSLLAPGASPLGDPKILVLPVLTLLCVSIAWTVRLVRVGVVEVQKSDYVQMARMQGIGERRVLSRYVLRNALAPSVQVFALSIQFMFGGVIVTEAVFNYPGLGTQLVSAVQNHDGTQVQAISVLLAVIYIATNIIADLMVVLLVPKLRTQS